jgi:hypothetical protein
MEVQSFVFGSYTTSPTFNMLGGCITGTQHYIPQRNFARYLLMMFMFYSFIIRTLYQGSYFELLQSNPKHEEAKSISEMIEKDFRFYTTPAYMDLTDASALIKPR